MVSLLFTVFRGKGGDEGSPETLLISALVEDKRRLRGESEFDSLGLSLYLPHCSYQDNSGIWL